MKHQKSCWKGTVNYTFAAVQMAPIQKPTCHKCWDISIAVGARHILHLECYKKSRDYHTVTQLVPE